MFSAIIVMAGTGTRSGLKMNKALWELKGKPLFMYSYNMFKNYDAEIILVCAENDIPYIKSLNLDAKIVVGGEVRAESVYNGVMESCNRLCIIQDAARPFITKNMIDDSIEAMKNSKCAYVGISMIDTVRDKNSGVIDRSNLVVVQTPQSLYKDDYIKAYNMSKSDNISLTDDISYLEKYLNYKPTIIKGSRYNIKLTNPEDFKIAEYMEDLL